MWPWQWHLCLRSLSSHVTPPLPMCGEPAVNLYSQNSESTLLEIGEIGMANQLLNSNTIDMPSVEKWTKKHNAVVKYASLLFDCLVDLGNKRLCWLCLPEKNWQLAKLNNNKKKIVMEPQQFKSESWKQTKCQNKSVGALPSLKSEEKGEKSDGTLADPGKVRGVKKTKSNGTSTGPSWVGCSRGAFPGLHWPGCGIWMEAF